MWDLIFSIACSTLIFIVFRLYKTYDVRTPYAIVVNYFTACGVGLLLTGGQWPEGPLLSKPWLWPALALGVLFVTIFNLMARTSQNLGVSVASVATKMSLVIPVLLGLLLYGERITLLNGLGILLALAAVYFTSRKGRGQALLQASLWLPLLVFLGSGIIDASLKYLEATWVPREEFPLFSSVVFAAAGTTGLAGILRKPGAMSGFHAKIVVGGLALGIPNFFSVFFLLRALQAAGWNSATIFTLNNVAIVLCTTLLGVLLFREQLSSNNRLGILLAVVSILLVSF